MFVDINISESLNSVFGQQSVYLELKRHFGYLHALLGRDEIDATEVANARAAKMHINGNKGVEQGKAGLWKVGNKHAEDLDRIDEGELGEKRI